MKLSDRKTAVAAGVDLPAAARPEVPGDQQARLAGLLLVLITVMAYLPVAWNDFVTFDDPDYVTNNPMVTAGLSWAGFQWAFVGWHAGNWHPLTWLSHQADCSLFGVNAGAHHLVNVLFHATNAWLLFQLWRRLTAAVWPAALVAALFAWHPLHVESVAWVSERKDVLSTFWGLLTLLAYTEYAGTDRTVARPPGDAARFYWASLGLFALALLAKPMLVTLPCLLLLLDFWPLQRFTGPAHFWREAVGLVREKGPFFVLTAGSCVMTFLAQHNDAVIPLDQLPMSVRVANALLAAAGYLGQMFWPANLCFFYPLPRHLPAGPLVVSGLVLACVSALAWRWRWQHRWLATGWLWFLGMLVPVIGLLQVGAQAQADRYTYLPSVGIFAAVVFGGREWCRHRRVPAPWLAGAAAVALGGCLVLTEWQLTCWRNSETLFQRALAVTRDNTPAHLCLGLYYKNQGRLDEANREFQAALATSHRTLMPAAHGLAGSPAAEAKLAAGEAAEQKGDPAAAMELYRAAAQLDPASVEAHNNLGNLLDASGQAGAALEEYETAVRINPQAAVAHENLGTQLAKMGRVDAALGEYQTAARLAPASPHPAYLTGKLWLRQGNSGAAADAFEQALQLAPEDLQSLVFLARLRASDPHATQRNGVEAMTLAEKASALTGGNDPFVLGTLAMAYAEAGRLDDAGQTVRTALQLAPPGGKTALGLAAQARAYDAGQPWRDK